MSLRNHDLTPPSVTVVVAASQPTAAPQWVQPPSRSQGALTQAQKGLGSNRSRDAVLGKLFAPTVPLFTKQRNW